MKKLISLFLCAAMCASFVPVFAAPLASEEPLEPTESTAAATETAAETEDELIVITEAPTGEPTEVTTDAPVEVPTAVPTEEPTEAPTETPTPVPRDITVYYDGIKVPMWPTAKLINGTAMVPIRALGEYIGFKVWYDKAYNSEALTLGKDAIYFNVGYTYTTIFGTDVEAKAATMMLDGTVYVALRTFADGIQSELTVQDDGVNMSIYMKASEKVNKYFWSSPVNTRGIDSRTNYLVWVSKGEYKVRVYEGKQYQWRLLRESPCAIGAPGTPTVTGSFEYKYKDRWDYGTYYVGPCLVFYRGYALHSVLLYQNGTEYDGRVNCQISHGCVRMKKSDIDWIAATIPVNTRIYVTE